MAKCIDGQYWHRPLDADGNKIYPNTAGITATCADCNKNLLAEQTFSWSATIIRGDETDYFTAMVEGRGESKRKDPLVELSNAIGANLPFAVDAVTAYGNLVGSFKGGRSICIRVTATTTIDWAEVPSSDD